MNNSLFETSENLLQCHTVLEKSSDPFEATCILIHPFRVADMFRVHVHWRVKYVHHSMVFTWCSMVDHMMVSTSFEREFSKDSNELLFARIGGRYQLSGQRKDKSHVFKHNVHIMIHAS